MVSIFLKTMAKIGFSLALVAASGAALSGHFLWALGVLTAACWMFLNVYFLFRLLAVGLKQAPSRTGGVFFLSILKFPVIYLAGYFILKTRYFPIGSILVGLTVFMAGLAAAWMTKNAAS